MADILKTFIAIESKAKIFRLALSGSFPSNGMVNLDECTAKGSLKPNSRKKINHEKVRKNGKKNQVFLDLFFYMLTNELYQ